MIAVIAALPREVAGLVRGVRPDAAQKQASIYTYRLPRGVVVCAGMGTERVTLAVRAALDVPGVTELLSVGLAGGCNPELHAGSLLEAGIVVDALTGVRYDAPGSATVVTTHAIAGVREKERLFAAYAAAAVDMEAATVARLAQLNGLPFQAIKAISDAHDFELSSLSRFTSAHGHFRTRAFALHTALRPARWRKTIQLGSNSQRGLAALTRRLQEIVR